LKTGESISLKILLPGVTLWMGVVAKVGSPMIKEGEAVAAGRTRLNLKKKQQQTIPIVENE
jgi:hypothetical protein